MTTGSTKRFAMIIERNGEELARDVLPMDGVEDVSRHFMLLVRRHEIDSFEEPVRCRIEEVFE